MKSSAWGIQAKLLCALGLVALIPPVLILFFIYFKEVPSIIASSGSELEEIALTAANEIRNSYSNEIKKLQLLTHSPKIQALLAEAPQKGVTEEEKILEENWPHISVNDPTVRKITTQEMALYLENFLSLEPALYREIFITDSRGMALLATRKPPLYDLSNTAWWNKIRRTGKPVFYLEIKRSATQLAPNILLEVAIPIYPSKTTQFMGAIHATINHHELTAFLREILARKKGRVAFAAEEEKIFFSPQAIASDPSLSLLASFLPKKGYRGWEVYENTSGEREIRGFAPVIPPEFAPETLLSPSRWLVIVEQPLYEKLSPLTTLLFTASGITLCVIIGSFYIGLRITRQIVHPMHKLQHFAKSVGLGTLESPLPLDRSDEIGELAASFKEMAENLRKFKEENLAKSRTLEQVNEELKRQNQLKANFISMVSHELRSPLTTLAGYIRFLKDGKPGPLNHEQYECLMAADKQIRHLTYLIEQLLDISRIESGKQEVNSAPIYLPGVMNECLVALSDKANAKRIQFESHLPENLPLIYADRHHVVQIITNLLHNAVKFTPEKGKITVRAIDRDQFVESSIADSGQGIPPEFHQKVFDKFFRLEEGQRQAERGLGLGLSIVKDLVELNGGRIWVESKLGSGSEFFFLLPKYGKATL